MSKFLNFLMVVMLAGCGSCSSSKADEPPDTHLQLAHTAWIGWVLVYEMRDEEHKTNCYIVKSGDSPGVSCVRDQ